VGPGGGGGRGCPSPPFKKFFLKIAEERLQYTLALLFLAFSMFLASFLSHFLTKILGVAPPDPFLRSSLYLSHTTMSCCTLLGPPCRLALESPLVKGELFCLAYM